MGKLEIIRWERDKWYIRKVQSTFHLKQIAGLIASNLRYSVHITDSVIIVQTNKCTFTQFLDQLRSIGFTVDFV